MLITIALLAAAAPQPPQCLKPRVTPAERMRKAAPKRLGELPRGEAYLAVYHTRGGCIVPVKVRDRR